MNFVFIFFSSVLLLGGLNLLMTDEIVLIPLQSQRESYRGNYNINNVNRYETTIDHSTVILGKPKSSNSHPYTSKSIEAIEHVVLASKSSQENNSKDAALHLMEALLIDPKYKEARLQLIDNLLNNKQSELAKETLDQALLYHPDTPVFIAMRARMYIHENDLQSASRLLDNALTRFQNDEELLALAASIHQQRREYIKAAKLYKQLTRINPLKLSYQIGQAMSVDHAGDTDTAAMLYHIISAKVAAAGSRLPFVDQRLAILESKANQVTIQ